MLCNLSTDVSGSMIQRADSGFVIDVSLVVRFNTGGRAADASIDQSAALPCIAESIYRQ